MLKTEDGATLTVRPSATFNSKSVVLMISDATGTTREMRFTPYDAQVLAQDLHDVAMKLMKP